MPATTYDFLESLQDPTPDELATIPDLPDWVFDEFDNDDFLEV